MRSILAVASLMPMIFFIFASFATVSANRSQAVRDGTLYKIIGMATVSAMVLKQRQHSLREIELV